MTEHEKSIPRNTYSRACLYQGTVATLAIPTMISQGLLNIPLLIVMDVFIGLYGMIWTQLVVEVIMLPVSLGMYFHTLKALRQPQDEGTGSK